MEIISLRIRTKDEAYGEVLATVLKRNYAGFLITAESLQECVTEEEEAAGQRSGTGGWGLDLALCDEKSALEDGEVLLVDSPALENVGEDGQRTVQEGPVCLFKYQPAREMIGKILGLCSARMHRQIFRPRGERCRIVGVFSGAGGTGCTAVSLALAQMSARLRGSRPLVVPLGQLPRGGAMAPAAGVMPVREYIYRTLRDTSDGGESLLPAAVACDAFGVGRFAGLAGENPFYRLSGEAMKRMLKEMSGGDYDRLFLDVGTVLNEASYTVLRAADRLVMLAEDPEEDRLLCEHLRTACGGGVLQKIIPVRNSCRQHGTPAIDKFYEDDEQMEQETWNPAGIQLRIPPEPALETGYSAALRETVFPLEGSFADAVFDLLTLLDRDLTVAAGPAAESSGIC